MLHTDTRRYVYDFYKEHLQGKSVVNKDKGITIHFTSIGRKKIAYGEAMYATKAAIITCLKELLEVAEYNNFGLRKTKDKSNILGYLNFKAKVMIDGQLKHVRIAVVMTKDYKFYYNHEVNIIKENPTP
ncbi:MAG: hypothetical protein LBO69_06165 [Ignavibacteria bacterium]|nr:hypothetical protein [Ignavibacteria bacterium]